MTNVFKTNHSKYKFPKVTLTLMSPYSSKVNVNVILRYKTTLLGGLFIIRSKGSGSEWSSVNKNQIEKVVLKQFKGSRSDKVLFQEI